MILELQEPLAQQAQSEQRVVKGRKASRVILALQEQQAPKGQRETRVFKAPKVRREQLVVRVRLALLVRCGSVVRAHQLDLWPDQLSATGMLLLTLATCMRRQLRQLGRCAATCAALKGHRAPQELQVVKDQPVQQALRDHRGHRVRQVLGLRTRHPLARVASS